MQDARILDVFPPLGAFPPLDEGAGLQPAASLPVTRLPGGLINDTYALGRRHVLQRLHPIFAPPVNDDIYALLPHLRAAGVPVPDLVLTREGATCVEAPDGTWRLLTRLEGETRHRLREPADARQAGAMLARFHSALRSLNHSFRFERAGAHDTDAHVAGVRAALRDHADHPLAPSVESLADALETLWANFGPVPTLPLRIIHGDPKISNLLWQGGEVVAVLDLDTMGYSGIDIELGDALRSWANTGPEDAQQPALCLQTVEAALDGYLQGAIAWVTEPEVASLPRALERIALELSARFAADALRERYFGWAPDRYATRGLHNLVRAQNQLGLAQAAVAARDRFEAIVAAAASSARA